MWYILLIVIFLKIGNCEYIVGLGRIPSYMEMHLPAFQDSNILKTISINVSVSKFTGILLQAVISNGDEFIIRFSNKSSIIVQSKEANQQISVEEFCQCDPCQNVPLALSVEVKRTHLSVSCNKKVTFFKNKFTFQSKDPSKQKKVVIWLVNIPPNRNIPYYSEQMEGRFHEIVYGLQQMKPEIRGDAIVDLNRKLCNEDKCNGGLCQKNYEKDPKCDCTNTFGSGVHCEDESRIINKEYYGQSLYFGSIKLSWRSDSAEIFLLKSNETRLSLLVEDGNLAFYYESVESLEKKRVLSHYSANLTYVLVLTFGINLEFHLHNVKYVMISVRSDLSKQTFNYLRLSSGTGLMDIVHKSNSTDMIWNRLTLDEIMSQSLKPSPAKDFDSSIKTKKLVTEKDPRESSFHYISKNANEYLYISFNRTLDVSHGISIKISWIPMVSDEHEFLTIFTGKHSVTIDVVNKTLIMKYLDKKQTVCTNVYPHLKTTLNLNLTKDFFVQCNRGISELFAWNETKITHIIMDSVFLCSFQNFSRIIDFQVSEELTNTTASFYIRKQPKKRITCSNFNAPITINETPFSTKNTKILIVSISIAVPVTIAFICSTIIVAIKILARYKRWKHTQSDVVLRNLGQHELCNTNEYENVHHNGSGSSTSQINAPNGNYSGEYDEIEDVYVTSDCKTTT